MDLRAFARTVPIIGPALASIRNGPLGAVLNTISKSRGVHP